MDNERLEMVNYLLKEGYWEFYGEEDVKWLVKQVKKQQKEIEKLKNDKKAFSKIISADIKEDDKNNPYFKGYKPTIFFNSK